MPGKFERRRRGRQPWVEPAERDWCVRRLQHDQVLPLGSLTYRQAALVIGLLSTVRFIHHARDQRYHDISTASIYHLRFGWQRWLICHRQALGQADVPDASIGSITCWMRDASLS